MAMKYPYADHLTNEEVDYELVLRNQLEERHKDMPSKLRLLRRLIQEDKKEGKQYLSPYQFEAEIDLIRSRIDQIELLLQDGAQPKLVSRLRHYYLRVQRSSPANGSSQGVRIELMDRIDDLLQRTTNKLPPSDNGTDEDEAVGNKAVEKGKENITTTTESSGNKSLGAIPKGKPTPGPNNNATVVQPSYEEMQNRVIQLERQIERLQQLAMTNMLEMGNAERGEQFERRMMDSRDNRRHEVRSHVRRSVDSDYTQHRQRVSSDSDEESGQYNSRGWQRVAVGHSTRVRGGGDRCGSSESNYSQQREREPRHYRRIEHWKLFFSGDTKSISVENFLYKLKKIARREGVSDNGLLRDIHLVLEGQASDWFFTYVDEFDSWENFEKRIRYRFGNPNQDQGIRLKIQERKQQRGESFIAFVTEIERLNKMLSTPLSRRRKFEVVWDNMRQHYRSKIATISVRDLDHLIRLNHGIDAADPNLQQLADGRFQRNIHQVECNLSGSEREETDIIDAMRINTEENNRGPIRFAQTNQQTANRGPIRSAQTNQQTTEQSLLNACWNCKRPGHNWRDCREPRRIFCYGCGELGQTIRSCNRCAGRDGRRQFRQNQGNQ